MKILSQWKINNISAKKKKKTKLPPLRKMDTVTIQGLDTSIFSMLENGLTEEGETKSPHYSENELINVFSDPLEVETEFEREYQRQFFDNLRETSAADADLSAKNEPSITAPKNATTTEQNGAPERTEA